MPFPQRLVFSTLVSILIASTSAQSPLISTTLPSCAQSCPILIQAQSACLPPPLGAAAASSQQTYTSCFCQSSYLTPLKGAAGSATAVCPICSPQDMTTTQTWYNGLCADPAKAAANAQQSSSSSSTTTQAGPTKAVQTAQATGAKSAGGVTQDTNPHGSWISTHYRWVIMLIVVFLGLGVLAWAGWWFHRRYQRRQELGDHSRTGQPDLGSWGPGQSVHEFGAAGATSDAAQNEKGKARENVRDPAPENPPSRSKRLKKAFHL